MNALAWLGLIVVILVLFALIFRGGGQSEAPVQNVIEEHKRALRSLDKGKVVIYENLKYTVMSRVWLRGFSHDPGIMRYDLVDVDGTKFVLFIQAAEYEPWVIHLAQSQELSKLFSVSDPRGTVTYNGRRYEAVENKGYSIHNYADGTVLGYRLVQYIDVEATVPSNSHLREQAAPFCERFGNAAQQTYLRKRIKLDDLKVAS